MVRTALYLVFEFALSNRHEFLVFVTDDHRSGSIVDACALACAATAAYVASAWYLDVIGGIGISVYIFVRWVDMGRGDAVRRREAVPREEAKAIEAAIKTLFTSVEVKRMRVFLRRGVGQERRRYLVDVDVVSGIGEISHDVQEEESLRRRVEEVEGVERARVRVVYSSGSRQPPAIVGVERESEGDEVGLVI